MERVNTGKSVVQVVFAEMPLSAEQFLHSFDYDEIFLVSCTDQTRPRQTSSVWASFTHRVQLSVKRLNIFSGFSQRVWMIHSLVVSIILHSRCMWDIVQSSAQYLLGWTEEYEIFLHSFMSVSREHWSSLKRISSALNKCFLPL